MKKVISVFVVFALVITVFSFSAYAVSPTYSSTRSFIYLLDDANIKYTVYGVLDGGDECVTVSNSGDYFSYDIDYFFDSNLENAALRVFDIITYKDADYVNVLKTVNDLNSRYKYVKLYADESDNTVTADADLIFRTHDVGEICLEATLYMAQFLDTAYKELRIYNIA